MSGKRYVVRDGDTLWDIAEQHLSDPMRWPEIFEHNNAEEVVNLSGSRIIDPDLILVGQVIYIPDAGVSGPGTTGPGPERPNLRPEHRDRGRVRARREVLAPSYKLDLPSAPIWMVGGGYVAKVEMKGSVKIQSNRPIDALTFSNESFEVSARHEVSTVMQRLVGSARFKFDPKTGTVSFENGLTIHSNHPYVPSASVSMGVSATTGLPVAKASVKAPTIRGRINHYVYLSPDFSFTIEVTPQPRQRQPQRPQLRPEPAPAPQPNKWPSLDVVVGVGLLVGVVILVTATIAEDVVTAGAGLADDPASFALAATMAHRGWVLLRSGAAMVPVYVQSAGPAARMAVAR
jgi:hypothetical protein